MRKVAWLVALASCALDTSGVGEDESSGGGTSGGGSTTGASTTAATTSGDPTSDGDPTRDPSSTASDDSTGDGELGAFGEPTTIDELNTDDIEDDPTLRSDLLEIFFSRSSPYDPGSEDIYRATRRSVGDPFDAPELVDELSFPGSADASPELSSDGLIISFSGAWPGGPGGNDVMIAYRDDFDTPWSDPVRIDELVSDRDDAALAMTADLLVGYYCRDFGGTAYWDIMRTTRSARDQTWEDGMPLDAVNGDGRDCAPWVDADDSELWFASVRPGGAGAEDIWRVAIEGDAFATPTPIAELNSMQADEDPWLSADGHTIVFASNRTRGNFDIWTATR